MMNDANKIKLSIRLLPAAYDAAKTRADASGAAVSMVVAEAATRTLLATLHSDREAEVLQAVKQVFFKLHKLETRQKLDSAVITEMVGLGTRAFFNHIPEISDSLRADALLSGKVRFKDYLDALVGNIRQKKSLLGEIARLSAAEAEVDAPSAGASSITNKQPAPPAPPALTSPPNGQVAAVEEVTPSKDQITNPGRLPTML